MNVIFKFNDGDSKELPTFVAVQRVAIHRVRTSNLPIKITYYVDDAHNVESATVVHHTFIFPDPNDNNKFIIKDID